MAWADGVVIGEERAHFHADVAPDALLEAVLDGLHAAAVDGAGAEVLDALDRTELGTLAAREAEVHVHEGDLARALLLLADLVGVGGLGNLLLLQAAFDDVNRGHRSLQGPRTTSRFRAP